MAGRLGGCHVRRSDSPVCVQGLLVRLKKVMGELVRRDDGVRLAAPRVQRLSAEMEREATRLLAALLADAVASREAGQGGVPIRPPAGPPVGPPIAPPVKSGGPSRPEIRSKQARLAA